MAEANYSAPPVQARGVVHHLIADTAKGLAAEFWEQMATGRKDSVYTQKARNQANQFYRTWPSQKAFVFRRWDHFINAARSSLTLLLESKTLPQMAKDDIAEALLLDGTVNPKRMSPQAAVAEAALKLTRK